MDNIILLDKSEEADDKTTELTNNENMITIDQTGDLKSNDEAEAEDNNLDSNSSPLSFDLDTNGDLESVENKDDNDATLEEIPSYHSAFTGFLTDPEFNMDTGKPIHNDAKPKKSCFNCLGDHSISECKEKYDLKRIAENKRKILGSKATANVRYHEDPENKYSHIKPGHITHELRRAMGINSCQLPEFIYRMRVLGYPPGWLREAEIHRSDIALFGGDGAAVDHPDDETGEIDNLVKYRPEKLLKFPGFNVKVPRHMKDDWKYYRSCPMQKHHHIEEFRSYMNVNKSQGYKRKRLKLDADASLNVTSEMDMSGELDDSVIEIDNSSVKSAKLTTDSPCRSIEDGEILDVQDNENVCDSESSESKDAVTSINSTEQGGKEVSCSDADKDKGSVNVTKSHHKEYKSTNLHLGAHIPSSVSVCKQLPNPDLWTVDVHDHILFENLSDSTGTWDQMKGVMQKVQSKMKSLHS